MAERQATKNRTRQSSRGAAKGTDGFTTEERAAMKERSRELKRAKSGKADGEADVLAKIGEMSDHDRAMAQRVHEIVTTTVPELTPRTWYGMPAYAKEGKVLCFFKSAAKFKTRYATLGFSDTANLDDGEMWPTDFALLELGPQTQKKVATLVKKAVS